MRWLASHLSGPLMNSVLTFLSLLVFDIPFKANFIIGKSRCSENYYIMWLVLVIIAEIIGDKLNWTMNCFIHDCLKWSRLQIDFCSIMIRCSSRCYMHNTIHVSIILILKSNTFSTQHFPDVKANKTVESNIFTKIMFKQHNYKNRSK